MENDSTDDFHTRWKQRQQKTRERLEREREAEKSAREAEPKPRERSYQNYAKPERVTAEPVDSDVIEGIFTTKPKPESTHRVRAGPKTKAKPSGKRPWLKVDIIEDLDGIQATVGTEAFGTLLSIRGFAGKDPYAYPSLQALMKRTRLKRTSQRKAIRTLKEHRLIWVYPRRTKDGKQTSSHYWLRPPTDEEIDRMGYPERGSKDDQKPH